MAETRDSTVRGVQQELRRLRYDIGQINKRLHEFACTNVTLDHMRAKVDPHEAELADLQKQGKLDSALSLPSNQQAGKDRFLIPIYSRERSTLSRFLIFSIRGHSRANQEMR